MTENQAPTCSLTCWHVSLDGIHQRLAHKVIPFVDGHKISCFCSIHLLVVHCKPNEPFLGLMNNSHRQLGYSDVNSTAKRIFSFFKKSKKELGKQSSLLLSLLTQLLSKYALKTLLALLQDSDEKRLITCTFWRSKNRPYWLRSLLSWIVLHLVWL